ncbi:hypothetical protein, partial [Spirosoma profusum]|uniref:hypothetical protein n=1 Tax=Spirosoma profusum TaxID=2771354 RepID=UPI001CC249D5
RACPTLPYLPLADGHWAYLASWMEWSDFYGSNKNWRIIFIIFFLPAHNGINSMNQLISDSV